MTTPTSVALVNDMDRAAFVARFGGIYERSPWVAEGAWDARPFADGRALEETMRDIVLAAGRDRQLELLRAHPRLGTRRALSGYSRAEQSSAGLTSAAETERAELARLNRAYEEKFGFPFILAVRNAAVPTILESCRSRIDRERPAELEESLRQVFQIAHFRLSDLIHDGDPASR